MKHGFDSRTEYVPSVNASVFQIVDAFLFYKYNPSLPVFVCIKPNQFDYSHIWKKQIISLGQLLVGVGRCF